MSAALLKDVLWNLYGGWLAFTDWTKREKWRYRVCCAIALPTVFPLCTLFGAATGFLSAFRVTSQGWRSLRAGRPT